MFWFRPNFYQSLLKLVSKHKLLNRYFKTSAQREKIPKKFISQKQLLTAAYYRQYWNNIIFVRRYTLRSSCHCDFLTAPSKSLWLLTRHSQYECIINVIVLCQFAISNASSLIILFQFQLSCPATRFSMMTSSLTTDSSLLQSMFFSTSTITFL